ncbi:beta-parvin isoform X2 [Fopius arisanus]|uniref:Beta-parvin isoform X2 n=1 Tax=Fopius arisanus TaxID=64838 RepID=A0A0C9R753_9HYME|nr:PREDICTED: beta-parvin isoform X2 [Fopius arisanus]
MGGVHSLGRSPLREFKYHLFLILPPLNHESIQLCAVAMASPRPKSPRTPLSVKKEDKEESFWDKIGTLGRKKRIKEVQEVQEEGKYAIDSPGLAANPDSLPEDYALDENEERSMIEPRSLEDPKVQELIFVLIEWINDELANHRIIVKDIVEDLYDGQVLQKLIEKLTGDKLDVPEVTQSEEGQKQKLEVVLSAANRILGRYPPYKWSVESIHSKDIVPILHLLVGLARQYRAPVRLPERVAVQVVVVRKKDGQLIHRTVREEITSTYDDLGMRCERDAFDTLFDSEHDKLAIVKKSLVTFVNKHLSKVHLEVTDLDTQFHDGVFLTLLLGLLEGFFVPLGSFHLTPKTLDQKVHNVSFAFDLMQDVGLPKPKARPEDIVNLDLKSTLRVLYNLFTKYKEVN